MTLTPVRTPVESRLRRMEALATLPVFVTLAGQRVVVAGGSEAAAWKAELAAAAGAQVDVFAAAPTGELVELAERGAASGTVAMVARAWTRADIAGAALAICDAEDDTEAAGFAAAARDAGVPFNVIDRPAFCSFRFGSIVNRSPVVVGIATDGAAPILGQAIRRRIETLLPPALADWAGLAASLRVAVMERFAPGGPRRAFWENFVDRAFSGRAPNGEEAGRLLAAKCEDRGGKVVLVGAGPGDAGLLTLNAVRALQGCDVILFDDLVSDEVLELARREAKRIAVGKRGARESCRQDDITALMIRLAKSGRTVVRLKGGDPSVFGRSGEEIAALRAESIEVEVVPGITSASAMAARAGVSLTHRDHAQVVSFMTGHSRHGSLPETLDIGALVGANRTAVVYMGARTAGDWVARAIAAGTPPDMAAIAMGAISRPDERRWTGRLADIPEAVRDFGEAPVLIGVGEAFAAAGAALGVGDVPLARAAS